MRNPVYINGRNCVSPQLTYNNDLDHLDHVYENIFEVVEPDYKSLPAGMIGRRMGKLTKMSIYAAIKCLEEAGIEVPDAIITGSGLGCMIETEKFLTAMIESNEGLLNPTAFMQSTHNTIGGQIALILGCKSYNFTYVQKGFSFESALLDGMMSLWEEPGKKILIGGLDELTEQHISITTRLKFWKKRDIMSNELMEAKDDGTMPGIGSAFFALSSEKNEHTYSQVVDLHMEHELAHRFDARKALEDFLERNQLGTGDVDLFILGRTGDGRLDPTFDRLEESLPEQNFAYFKHLCGEYYTASSFAFWLADMVIKEQRVPEEMMPTGQSNKFDNVVIYDQYQENDHSFYLLRNCRNSTS